MLRVQIPADTDHWMMGDRYGEVVKICDPRKELGELHSTYKVRLDKSGEVRRFVSSDCEVI